MKPSTKLAVTSALFWGIVLGLIVLATTARADERERDRDREERDRANECVVPEADTWAGTVALGAGLVGFALWKHYRRNAR